MARTRNYRYSDMELLVADCKRVSTQPQREKIEKFETTGWYVYAARQRGNTTVVFMSHKESTGPAVVYPDGAFVRAIKGHKKVEYSWTRADAAYAEVANG